MTRRGKTRVSYVGKAHGGNAPFVGLVVSGTTVSAYACNGKDRAATFSGRRAEDAKKVAARSRQGARLEAQLGSKRATGTVTYEQGDSFRFSLPAVGNRQGFYLAKKTANGRSVSAGWVILPNGDQRGNIRIRNQVQPAPALDPQNPTVTVSGTGELQAELINAFIAQVPD